MSHPLGPQFNRAVELTLCYDCLIGAAGGVRWRTPAELFGVSINGSVLPVCREHSKDPWYFRHVPLEEGKSLIEVMMVLES